MEKLTKTLAVGMLATSILVACGSDEGTSNSEENSNGNNINDEIESEQTEETGSNGGDVLSIGETGIMRSTVGEYEVTVESVMIIDEHEEAKPRRDEFVIFDVSIKNIGDDVIEGESISRVALANDDERVFESTTFHDFVDHIEGEIAPGETVTGQLMVDNRGSDYYNLIFGWGHPPYQTN